MVVNDHGRCPYGPRHDGTSAVGRTARNRGCSPGTPAVPAGPPSGHLGGGASPRVCPGHAPRADAHADRYRQGATPHRSGAGSAGTRRRRRSPGSGSGSTPTFDVFDEDPAGIRSGGGQRHGPRAGPWSRGEGRRPAVRRRYEPADVPSVPKTGQAHASAAVGSPHTVRVCFGPVGTSRRCHSPRSGNGAVTTLSAGAGDPAGVPAGRAMLPERRSSSGMARSLGRGRAGPRVRPWRRDRRPPRARWRSPRCPRRVR